MKAFLTAGLALATCAAFAAVKENFDATAVDSLPASGWTGDGKVQVKTGGSADSEHSLAIDGTVTCTNSGATPSEFAKTSFLVKAPSEGTATTDLPTGDDVAGCQIAVATGEATGDNLKVMVFSKTNATEAGWAETGLTVPTNEWFEVALDFDYSAALRKATVSINGTAVSPYTLVSQPASQAVTNIASLAFVGAAEIDEVLIDEALPKSELASTLYGLQIYTNSLPAEVAAAVATANLKTDNNCIKHIEAGLTPSGDELVFNATALSTVTENNVVKTVITVPCDADFGQVYKVVITDAAGAAIPGISPVAAEAGAISGNSRALKFQVPATEAKVLKFNVEVGAPAAN